jgi:hypothetical protein
LQLELLVDLLLFGHRVVQTVEPILGSDEHGLERSQPEQGEEQDDTRDRADTSRPDPVSIGRDDDA